jgi:hypothetical protein
MRACPVPCLKLFYGSSYHAYSGGRARPLSTGAFPERDVHLAMATTGSDADHSGGDRGRPPESGRRPVAGQRLNETLGLPAARPIARSSLDNDPDGELAKASEGMLAPGQGQLVREPDALQPQRQVPRSRGKDPSH